MTEMDQSSEKNRIRIRGWLLVYAIGPAGFGCLAALGGVAELWRYGGDDLEWAGAILLLIVYAVGLYLLIAVRQRITRFYHLGLTGCMAAALAAIAISTADPAAALACAGMCVWMGYWLRSKRVRETYCNNSDQF